MSLVTRGVIAVGSGAVLSRFLGSFVRGATENIGSDLVVGGIRALTASVSEIVQPIWTGTWYLLTLWVIFELRFELAEFARVFLQVCLRVIEVCQSFSQSIPQRRLSVGIRNLTPPIGTEHELLTCHSMVFEGFLLTERSGEWDEVWVAGVVPDTTTLIARSTVEDGSDWLWTLLKCEVGFLKPPSGVGAARTAPAGVGVDSVNWICAPDHIHQKWNPTAGEMATLKQEAALLGMQLKAIGIQDAQVTVPGRGMSLIPLVLQPAANVVSAQVPRGDPGALGPGNQGGGGGDAFNLQSLSEVIQELKDMAKKSKDEDKLKKRSHKKKKKTDKKKKKKKRRGSSTSSSRSSRSRSSQSSSRASSSRSSGPLQWKAKAKDRKVKFEEIHAVDREKFKRKGELMAYATKHPGALTAHFLASIYARLSKGRVERSSQLREASVVAWAAQHSGLSEVRDVREVLTLAEAMDSINRKEIERAMDILAQRILAIQQAKRKGGSWDKAEAIELIPGGTSLASSSMLALTN